MFYSARSLYCWSLRRAGPLICVQRSGQSGQWSWLPGSSSGSECEEEGGEARQVQWGVRSWEHGTSHNLTLRLRLLGGLDTVDTGLSGHTTSSRSRSRSSLWITGVSRSWTEVLPPQVTRDVNCLVNEKNWNFIR